jgi:hypothetical protein
MPSLLAKAAMMALGATGNRRLTGDISPCTHDACGRPRMLLAYESATGDPKFLDGSAYSSTERELYAPANGIPGLTENDAKSYITINNNGKVEVHVHLDDSQGYDHAQLQCSLEVATTLNATASSSTFQGTTVTHTIVGEDGSSEEEDAVDARGQTVAQTAGDFVTADDEFKAEVDTPAVHQKSLGDAVMDISVVLTCKDPSDGLKDATIPLKDASGNDVQVRHRFKQSSDDQTFTFTESNPSLSTSVLWTDAQHGHKKLPVQVQGTTSLAAADIRFPEGEWGTFGEAGTSESIRCSNTGALKTEAAGGVKETVRNVWYDAQYLNTSAANAEDVSIKTVAFGAGTDTGCAGGVCTGRAHTVNWDYTTHIGFEIPLGDYYATAPGVTCQTVNNPDTSSQSSTFTIPQDKALALTALQGAGADAAKYRLGQVSNALLFSTGSFNQAEGKYGSGFFGTDSSALAFGTGRLFNVAGSTAADWFDLRDQYDYSYALTHSDDNVANQPDFDGNDSGDLAAQGASIAEVNSALAGKIASIISDSSIARPVKYSQQRTDYLVGGVSGADVKFRRSRDDINSDLQGGNAGVATYIGNPALEAPDSFAGPDLDLVKGITAQNGAAAYFTGALDVRDADGAYDSTSGTYAMFLSPGDDDALFQNNSVVDSSDICGDFSPWCRSKDDTDGDTTAFLCQDSSVTLQRTAVLTALDDRMQQSPVTVTQTYLRPADSREIASFSNAAPASQTVLAGATLAASDQQVTSATLGTMTLQYTPGTTAGLAYNCDGDAENVASSSSYHHPCTDASTSLTLGVPHTAVYSEDQVTYSLSGDYVHGSALSEWSLQREQTDLTFTVSSAAGGLLYSDNFAVTANVGDTSFMVECARAQDNASAACTIKDFQLASYGSDLGHGQICDTPETSEGAGDATAACPVITLSVSETFKQPADANGNAIVQGAFVPAAGKAQTCHIAEQAAESHVLPGRQSIKVRVVGKDTIYHGAVSVKAKDQSVAFASADADDGSKIPGANGEYLTDLSASEDAVHLPNDLSALHMAITLEADPAATGNQAYQLESVGSAYTVYACDQQTFSAACGTTELTSKTVTIAPGAATTLYVQIQKSDDSDPCLGKFAGEDAYGSDVQFKITSDGDAAGHTFKVPVTCHYQKDVVIDSVTARPGDTWFRQVLKVVVQGSAIDPAATLSFLETETAFLASSVSPTTPVLKRVDDQLEGSIDIQTIESCGDNAVIKGRVAFSGADDFTVTGVTCAKNAIKIRQGADQIADGALIHPNSISGNTVFISMSLEGRNADVVETTIKAASPSEHYAVFSSTQTDTRDIANYYQNADSAQLVGFEIRPPANSGDTTISCNFITITLQSKTTTTSEIQDVDFRLQCPRNAHSAAVTDALSLDFSVSNLVFGKTASSFDIPADGGVSSVVGFAASNACDANWTPANDCALSKGANTFGAAGPLMTLMGSTCDGTLDLGTVGSDDDLSAKGYVVRKYSRTDINFGAQSYCGLTEIDLSVKRTASASTTVGIAQTQDMEFDVLITELAHQTCNLVADSGAQDGYKFHAKINLLRKHEDDAQFISDDITNNAADQTLSDGFSVTGADNEIVIAGPCRAAQADEKSIAFDMQVIRHGITYAAQASVQMDLTSPVELAKNIAFDDAMVGIALACADAGADGILTAGNGTCGEGDISVDKNIKLTVSITDDDEDDAFEHVYREPQIQIGTAGAQDVQDLDVEYKALLANNAFESLVSTDNNVVTLRALALAGEQSVTVSWVVERTTSSRRRLRQTISYTLGADGSVEKSTSFSVAPAVRESEGAAVQSGDKIVEEITETTDADGVTTRTTKVSDKSEISANGLEIASVAMGGVALLGVVIILIKGCATGGIKAAGAIPVTSVDKQLWNRNRFAP